MKRTCLICVIVLMISVQSCSPVLKLIYGISEPDFVDDNQLKEYTMELFGSDIPVYSVKYTNWSEGNLFGVPDMYVFDHEGNYIPYKDSLRPNCNGPADQFVKDLQAGKEYYLSEEFNLNSFVSQLETTNCTVLNWQNEEVDFYLFFTFTTWSGRKLYKEKTKIWLEDLRNNHNIKYKAYAISEDWMQCWSDHEKKMILNKQ